MFKTNLFINELNKNLIYILHGFFVYRDLFILNKNVKFSIYIYFISMLNQNYYRITAIAKIHY